MLEHIPRFSNIFLPFHVNQTQKHKHKLISSKNKNTNTNPATELDNVTHKLCGLSFASGSTWGESDGSIGHEICLIGAGSSRR